MSNHAIVRTDLMSGTDVRSDLVSIKYMGANGSTPTEIDNGNVLKVGDLVEGEREIYVGAVPVAETPVTDLVLIASVDEMYDERKRSLHDYVNEAGKVCRGYRLRHGNIFSVTAEALTGSPAKGSKVNVAADTKLAVGGSGTAVGTIIAKETADGDDYYVIKID